MQLQITQDPVADRILSDDPFALLAGMMLDQQFPMERAFAGPAKSRNGSGPSTRPRSPRPTPRLSPTSARRRRPSTATAARWPPGCRRWLAWSRSATTATPLASGRRRPPAPSSSRASWRCRASGGRRRRSSSRCWPSSSTSAREGWEQAVGAYAEDGYRSVADVVDASLAAEGPRLQEGREGGCEGRRRLTAPGPFPGRHAPCRCPVLGSVVAE